MAVYCFKCKMCGARATSLQVPEGAVWRCCDTPYIIRDYQAEAVGHSIGNLRAEREQGSKAAYDRLFLPSNKDFAGPGDPDGKKGMRDWRNTHQPKAGNKAPRWPGDVDKQVF
jgi:hypothetical protein